MEKTKYLNVPVKEELRNKLKIKALQRGKPLYEFVEECLSEYVEKKGDNDGNN